MRQQYKTIDDLPARLPLFPLAAVILLPRALLPLNIFEPRYLAMVEDCLKGDRIIGIIQPAVEGGETGSPQSRNAPLVRVGSAGRITSYQELDNGRLLIGLTGLCRFLPGMEISSITPYRNFAVDYGPFARDLIAGDGEADVDRERLIETLKRFLAVRQATADWKRIADTKSEQLVNWLSQAAPFEGKEKQALLEAPTLKARSEMLIALAEMETAAGPGGTGSKMQ